MSNHLFDLIASRVSDGQALFLVDASGRRMSYGQMLDASAQMANALIDLGVKPGDRVAAQIEKSPEALLLYLGCVRAGAVFLPLNTAYTAPEVSYFIEDARPALFVIDPRRADQLAPIAGKVGASVCTMDQQGFGSLWDMAQAMPKSLANVARGPDDLAAILYTSGTTGRSKGAMLSHDNLASNALCLVDYWRFTKSDILLHALPIYHTHGLFVASNVVLLSGASMIFLARFDADDVMKRLADATAMMGVPTFYTRLLDHPGLSRASTKHIRLFISGSAPLLAETHQAWGERTGHAILERYGMSETNMNTSNPYDGDRVPGTVGFPLPGVDLRIADADTGTILPQGDIGVIEVRGPNVFKGYWNRPELNAKEFRADGFFITGDMGRIDGRGYVHIVGRAKDLIITGGFNVYPKEVEEEIDLLPFVLESAVIGLAHRDFGEGVTAVVIAKPGAMPTEAEILGALDGRLAKFKLPKRVLLLDELPRNTMGKVQKNVLRDRFANLYQAKS
jgi:malonyl-CoA/methylmalonyl-CoA synthetase